VIAFNNSSSRRDCGFGMARNSYKIGIRGKKNTGESNLQTPINDCASKEVRDRAIDPGRECRWKSSVEIQWKPRWEREKKRRRARILARQNSHVIPRVEFDDGVAAVASTAGLGLLHATSAIGSCPPVLRPMFDPPIDRRWFER